MCWRHDSPYYSDNIHSIYPDRTFNYSRKAELAPVYCTKCGGKLNKDYNYCPHCGEAIDRKQSENQCDCGAYFGPEDKYCSSCGKEKISKSKAAK